MSKKFLAKLLVLVMLLTMLPFSAFAADTVDDGTTAADDAYKLTVDVTAVDNDSTKIKLTVTPAAENGCTTYYSFSDATPAVNSQVDLATSALTTENAKSAYAVLSSNTSVEVEVEVLANATKVQVVRGTVDGTNNKLTVTAVGTGTINNNTGSQEPEVTIAVDGGTPVTLNTTSNADISAANGTSAIVSVKNADGYTVTVANANTEGSVKEQTVTLGKGTNEITITLTKDGADPITYKVTINGGGDVQEPEVSISVGDKTTKLTEGSNAAIDVNNGTSAVVSVANTDGYTVTVKNNNGDATETKTVELVEGENVITITLTKTGDQSTTLTYTVTINNTVNEDPSGAYTITNSTAADANGTLTVAESAKANEKVAVTVTPDTGYEVDTISVTYTAEDGTETNVSPTTTDSGFEFVMPAANVTIAVTFKQIPPQPSQNVSLLVNAVSDAGSDAGSKELLNEANLDATKTYVINVDHEVDAVTFTTNAVITKGEETISGESVTLEEGINEYTLTAGEKTFKLTIVRAKATQDPDTSVNASDVKTEESTTEDGKLTITAEVPETATLEQIANTDKGGTVSIPATKNDTSGDVTSSTVTLPQAVTESMKVKDVNVEIETNVGTVTIPSEAVVTALTDGNGDKQSAALKLVVESVEPSDNVAKAIFEVSIMMIIKDENGDTVGDEDTNITDLQKPIKLAFKFENKDGLSQPTLAHVDKTGGKTAYRSIKNSSYEPTKKIITGETEHLSEFAVVDLYQLEDFGEQKLTLRIDPSENWPGGVKVVVTNAVNIGSDPVYIVMYRDPVKDMSVYTVVRPEADGTVSFIAMNNSEVFVWEALDGALNADGTPNLSGRTNAVEDPSAPLGSKGEVVNTDTATVE